MGIKGGAGQMVRHIEVSGTGGVRLSAREFPDPLGHRPPTGPGVLLLHGLMGCATHWTPTAEWLAGRHRTVALDQRGHGHSEKPAKGPWDRAAYVGDVAAAIEQLDLAPAVVVGHAMGALTAWQLAAEHPHLVRALVICDMRASALGVAGQRAWDDWYRTWPLPFPSLDAARQWFGADDPRLERPDPVRAAYYAEVMTEAGDGWRPVFDPAHMLRTRERWVYDAHWEELAQVTCPTLVVRGLDGELGRAEAQEMVRVLLRGTYAEVPDAGHLVHLDQPKAWRDVVEPFLDGVLSTS